MDSALIADKLWDCPFCGDRPVVRIIGNEHTKKRKIEVRCNKCRCGRTDAAITHGFDWLAEVAIKNWNQKGKEGV